MSGGIELFRVDLRNLTILLRLCIEGNCTNVTIILWRAANRIGFENATFSLVSSFGVERKMQSLFLDCQFGRCINEPFECACYDGYNGSSCEVPICRKGCHPVNVSFHIMGGKWPFIAHEDQTLHGYLLLVGKLCTTLWLKGKTWYKARPHNQPLPLKLLIHSFNEIISVHSPN